MRYASVVTQGANGSRGLPIDAAAMLAASGALAAAIAVGDGRYSPGSLGCVLGALAVLLWRATSRSRWVLPLRPALGAVWATLAIGAWAAFRDQHPLWAAPVHPWDARGAELVNLVLVASYLPGLLLGRAEPRWLRHVRFAGFGAALVFAGTSLVRATAPPIDVWDMQQQGAAALLAGKNPYVTVFVRDTAPGVTGILPYTYPPTQLYVSLLGYVAGGDVRFTMLASVFVAGIALRCVTIASAPSGSSPVAEDAPALWVWLAPKLFLVLENAWIDPVPLALVALMFAARVGGRRRLEAILFGLALSSKQTMFWLAPLAAFILRPSRRQWFSAVVTAAATVAPFVVMAPDAFVDATVGFLRRLPPRPDALTIGSWLGVGHPWGTIALALAAAVVAYACLRAALDHGMRRPSLFGVSLTLAYVVFFVFNHQAFPNYYFFVSGLGALAAAVAWD